MRSRTSVVYCAIDSLISATGRALTGFPEFLEGLGEAGVPCVWVSRRNRHELDTPIRKLGHAAPFLAEDGCGVYLPEDYFHLKPAKTLRFARFTCIPVAEPLPAAATQLENLAEETGVEVVRLASLSPRELAQNVGMAQREAELLRQRDFDELFFFAGAGDAEIAKFRAAAEKRQCTLRARGNLWSLALHPSTKRCIRELGQLYDRAMRATSFKIGIATNEEASEIFPSCNRTILLTERGEEEEGQAKVNVSLPLFSPGSWEQALEAVLSRGQ